MTLTRFRGVSVCVTIALICIIVYADTKVFERCELTRELLKIGFRKEFLSNWMCLIEQESQRNTSAFVEKSYKTKYYGLFHIGSEWCKEGKKGGKCGISCEALLNEDIRDDGICAQSLWESQGFKYWPKWSARCKGQRLPDVQKCADYIYPPRPTRQTRNIKEFLLILIN